MAFNESLEHFLDTNDFGVVGVINYQKVKGILGDEYVETNGVMGNELVFTCLEADAATMQENDVLRVGDTVYTVAYVQPPADGMAQVILNR